jgi:hypothetical protein
MPNRALPILLLAALAGCTHWVRDETVLQAPVPARDQLQIFTPTSTIRAHGIRSDSTTLSYVPYVMPPDCDSCRVTVPLASVDSIRSSKLSPGRNLLLLGFFLALGFIFQDLPTEDQPT